MPQLEQPLMSQLAGEGQKYWRAVTLSVATPWYLFVYDVAYEDAVVEQTMLVEWEEVLAQLLASVPPQRRKGICRMEYAGKPRRWTQTWVSALWAVGESGDGVPRELIFKFEGDPVLRDANLQAVAPSASGELLFSVASQSHTRESGGDASSA